MGAPLCYAVVALQKDNVTVRPQQARHTAMLSLKNLLKFFSRV